MTAWQCYLQGWKGYVQFRGRASRREFWIFTVGNIALSMLLGITVVLLLTAAGHPSAVFYGSLVQSLFSLLVLLPFIAVGIRRMHDIQRSGWWFGMIFLTSGLAKLLDNILRHFATPHTYVTSQLVLGIALGWIPLIIVIWLCCQQSREQGS